jgi:hypothetical protein
MGNIITHSKVGYMAVLKAHSVSIKNNVAVVTIEMEVELSDEEQQALEVDQISIGDSHGTIAGFAKNTSSGLELRLKVQGHPSGLLLEGLPPLQDEMDRFLNAFAPGFATAARLNGQASKLASRVCNFAFLFADIHKFAKDIEQHKDYIKRELESLEFLPIAPAIASDEDDDSSEGSSIEHEDDSTAESTDNEAP